MGFPVNMPNDDYRVASMGQDNAATEITPAHWYSGLPSAIGTGFIGGLAAVGRTLADCSTSLTDMRNLNANDYGLTEEQMQSVAQGPTPVPFTDQIKAVQDWTKADPRTTGMVGQVAGGVTRGLTIFGLGSLLGSPAAGATTLGVTEGYNDYADSTGAGLDAGTALKKAALTGTAAFVGAYLPMALSGRVATRLVGMAAEAEAVGNGALAQVFSKSAQAASLMTTLPGRMATGMVVNTGFGMANRYATSTLLESAGYHDMAAQYKALDSEAIVADMVLGAAFGALHTDHLDPLHRPDPTMTDAAMEARKAEMVARGAAGLPTDMHTAGLDADLQERSLSDLVRGKVPEVNPEEAAAIIHGSVTDPERIQLNQDWAKANETVFGPLADFSESTRLEPGAENGRTSQAALPTESGEVSQSAGRTVAGNGEAHWDAATRTWRGLDHLGPEPARFKGQVTELAPDSRLQDYQRRNIPVLNINGVEVTAGPRPPYFSFHGNELQNGSPVFSTNPRNIGGDAVYVGQEHATGKKFAGEKGQVLANYLDTSKMVSADFRHERVYTPKELAAFGVDSEHPMRGSALHQDLVQEHGGGKGISDFLKSKGFNAIAYDMGGKSPAWAILDPRVTKNVMDATHWTPEEIARRQAFDPEPLGAGKTKIEDNPAFMGQTEAPKMNPIADEQMRQLAEAHPDLDVTMPDGTTAKAMDMPDLFKQQLEAASKDSNLFQTAVGCLLRTML